MCINPWAHTRAGTWPGADDINPATGVRRSIMAATLLPGTPVCLRSDDIEAINLLYPVCTGRAMVRDTADVWRCNQSDDARIGYFRVLARSK